jgi:hypothetical protein
MYERAAGCGTGALTAIGGAAPEIAGGALLTAGLTYTWERWEAGQELTNDMAQCSQIPWGAIGCDTSRRLRQSCW